MEGVLVSAKKEGSTITTTVVTNDKGQYSFPADRLEPGHYNITIRAAGYDLAGPKQVDVGAGAAATADIKLAKTKNVAGPALQRRMAAERARQRPDQVVPARLRRLPHAAARFSADAQPGGMEACSAAWAAMRPESVPTRPQLLLAGGPRSERPRVPADMMDAAANFLSSVTSSNPRPGEIQLEAAAAAEGQGHPCDRHRIRSAAQGSAAA